MSSYDEYEPTQTWDDDEHIKIPSKRRRPLPRVSHTDASRKLTRLYQDGGVLDSQTTESQYVNDLLLGSKLSQRVDELDVHGGRYAVSPSIPDSERLPDLTDRDPPKRLAGVEYFGSQDGGLEDEDNMTEMVGKRALSVRCKAEDPPPSQFEALYRDDDSDTNPFLDQQEASDSGSLSEQNSSGRLLLCSRCQSEFSHVSNAERVLSRSNANSELGSSSEHPLAGSASDSLKSEFSESKTVSKGTLKVDSTPTTKNEPRLERDLEAVPESWLRPSEDYPGTRLAYETIKRDFNAGGLLGRRDLIAVSLKVYIREQDAGRWPPTPRTIRRFWR
ncbi:hypothetical protein PHLGIDRAFT_30574 [Phlebiopsis gigantea 11061_1 CR5-6]|uniref:Uncharacterized protein n=1 Tax=Phlebiopsis gigantea (strain 11061_1 CR5-6) TaxID=745531 RepID=A0A0C3NMA3_PHLG1|nr:hypothetical protein PHLGIDRAFT_30574 [Phlebiopsis gigantea 11061_1 CR5-6]